MARTPVNWDPKRYGSVKHILKFDASTGTYSLQEQEHNYTGVNYNFSSLPSSSTTTSQTQTGTTQSQTGTTSAQTTQAFGNVQPQFAQHDNEDPFSASFSKDKTMTDANTVMGFKVDEDNKARAEMTDANVGHEAFDKSNLASDLPGRDMDKFRERFDQTYKDEWIEDTESNPRGSTYTGFILKSEADRIKRERKAKLDKMGKIPFIGTKLAAGSEILRALTPRTWRSTDTQQFNKEHFTAYTSGSMAGRITGDDGKYDPANNLYHGMNRTSAYGNLEKAGEKRIARIEKTIARNKKKGRDTSELEKRVDKFKDQQHEYRTKKNKKLVDKAVKKGASTMNPAEMHAATGGDGKADSGKSIICTQMYQQTQLEDWKKTMRLWYVFQKKYLTIEHQQGYHFLFKPFVNGMKKSKVLTALGKHCAIARTNDIKHIMFGTPFSLSGRLVRLVTEPICYITGKIKSWL
jgi:hypothetical protein